MRQECGYKGHVCGLKPVQFISRYRDQNDYCVNGVRVTLSDNGEWMRGTPEEREKVRLFALDSYADYLRSRADFRSRYGVDMDLIPLESL